MGRRLLLVLVVFGIAAVAAVPAALAAPPLQLDTGFGSQGLVTDPEAPPGFDEVEAMTVAPGRSIYVAAGSVKDPSTVVIARYWRDGELERSFGNRGYLTLQGLGPVKALAADNSGRLLVLSQEATISRIAGGRLDPTFGVGGSVSMAGLGLGDLFLRSLAALPGGAVAAAGSSPAGQMVVVELGPTGAPDTSFNGTGSRVVRFGPGIYGGANLVKPQDDGKLVLAGEAKNRPALARLLPDGRLDPGFGRDGRVRSPHRLRGRITALAVRRDGSIVAGANGTTSYPGWNRAMLLRYSPTGELDRGFGGIAAAGSRNGPHSIPVAVMRARRHNFLVTRGSGPSIRAYEPNGQPLSLGPVPGIPVDVRRRIAAAPQSRELVVAWTPPSSLPQGGEVELARFVVR
ncbi:MAG TPA: hypothetical protein VFS26_07220 [Solirubrobacterales bacterium]|nr:hypothetical protein [Solirubrobacterales bacterium]